MRVVLAALLVAPLLAGCTGNDDGDGLDEKVETRGWAVSVIYPDYSTDFYQADSDPGKEDTDGDGLNDFQEFLISSDPRLIDTDRDRLADGPILCPRSGSDLAAAIAEANILAHPDRAGCFLGEARWERGSMRIETKATSAHSDGGAGIDDGISDTDEIVGWDVDLRGFTRHVFSNPSFGSLDTDGDGLHDGNEKLHGLDPQNQDTDADGVEDLADAAPLGNLVLFADVLEMTVKTDKRLTGGVRLKVVFNVAEGSAESQPVDLSRGQHDLDIRLRLDVPDTATGLTAEGGAGQWLSDVGLEFYHVGASGDEPLRVQSRAPTHRLVLRYDAFADSWTGPNAGGTASGADADVKFDLDARVE